MRIIDKNTDFYDYLQCEYPDKSIVFDRTDSYIMSKDFVCRNLQAFWRYSDDEKTRFVLIQICNTFWLFFVTLTGADDTYKSFSPVDYEVELVKTWKDYSKKRRLISVDNISFSWIILSKWHDGRYNKQFSKEYVLSKADVLADAISKNDFKLLNSIDHCTIYRGNESFERHIPILKASGFNSCMDPADVYHSFEEYFSLEKSDNERTESEGITDKEKIENHGFDTKTSFRGKNKKENEKRKTK